jgi:hypothetical protein
MKLRQFAILLAMPLWACASQPSGTAAASGNAPTTLSMLGTPIYVAFKIPGCLAAAPILGPQAIASSVVPFSDPKAANGWQYFSNGVTEACGGSWVATPNGDAAQ